MRVLDKNEVSEVSGGTFFLLGGLLSLLKKPIYVHKPAHVPHKPAPKKHHC